MTELKREDLLETKWDVRDWSEEQRTLWQQECFQLGMKWYRESVAKLEHLNTEDYAFYYIEPTAVLMQDDHGCEQEFTELGFTEKQFTDMFPNYEAPKSINVVEEITKLFSEEMDKEDSEVDEDERGFERLALNKKVIPSGSNWVIYLKGLSREQLYFMESFFKTDCRYNLLGDIQDVVMGHLGHNDENHLHMWSNYSKDFLPSNTCTVVSFNDLFKYEDEL